MKIFILSVIGIYLVMEFLGSFTAWMQSKSNKEYWHRFADTFLSGALLCGFAKLLTILAAEVA